MIGIDYSLKWEMWMIYELDFCRCGNHVCKSILRGDTKEVVLEELKKMMEKTEK